MWLYNLYIPSLHDKLAHPRIWIDMPTLTTLSCQLWSNVVPKLEVQYSNIGSGTCQANIVNAQSSVVLEINSAYLPAMYTPHRPSLLENKPIYSRRHLYAYRFAAYFALLHRFLSVPIFQHCVQWLSISVNCISYICKFRISARIWTFRTYAAPENMPLY